MKSGKKIQKLKKTLNKREIIKEKKKNQTEILELKNTMKDMKNAIVSFNTRFDQPEEKDL